MSSIGTVTLMLLYPRPVFPCVDFLTKSSVSPICIQQRRTVAAGWSAPLQNKIKNKNVHNDPVSADTVTVVTSYLKAQSVHFSLKNLNRSNHLKVVYFAQLTAPLLQKIREENCKVKLLVL